MPITTGEIKRRVEQYIKDNRVEHWGNDEYQHFGLRFENKARAIGDTCENSRHNPEREDERDFPEYGAPGYDELPELDGTSAWNINPDNGWWVESFTNPWYTDEKEFSCTDHAYIIAGDWSNNHHDRDPNEIVIEDAVVVAVIF